MFHVAEHLRQRADLRDKMLALAGPNMGKALSDSEQKEYDALSSQLTEVNARLDRHGRGLPQRDETAPPPRIFQPEDSQTSRGHGSLKSNLKDLLQHATAEQREEVENLAAYMSGRAVALSSLSPSADGGVFIPTLLQTVIQRNFAQFSPVVDNCRLFLTDTGADEVFPVLSDSESAEQLDPAATTGLDATVSGDHPPTEITGPKLHAYKISSKPVFVPRELSTDTPIDILAEILGALLARVIRFENLRFTKGTGTSQAEGFLRNAQPFEHGGGILDLDAALELAYSVPPLYRPAGIYMASDATIKYLRKLKTGISGDKRQLWAFEDANATLGTPATLHGYRIVVNNDMDDVATDGTYSGKSVLAFGDYSRFVVRKAEQDRPYVYRWPIPAKDGWGLILFRRSDSKLLVPTAISKLTVGGS